MFVLFIEYSQLPESLEDSAISLTFSDYLSLWSDSQFSSRSMGVFIEKSIKNQFVKPNLIQDKTFKIPALCKDKNEWLSMQYP